MNIITHYDPTNLTIQLRAICSLYHYNFDQYSVFQFHYIVEGTFKNFVSSQFWPIHHFLLHYILDQSRYKMGPEDNADLRKRVQDRLISLCRHKGNGTEVPISSCRHKLNVTGHTWSGQEQFRDWGSTYLGYLGHHPHFFIVHDSTWTKAKIHQAFSP